MVGVSGGDVGSAVSGKSRCASFRSGVDGRRRKCLALAIGKVGGNRVKGCDGGYPGAAPGCFEFWGAMAAVERRLMPEAAPYTNYDEFDTTIW